MELKDLIIERAMQKVASRMEKEAAGATYADDLLKHLSRLAGSGKAKAYPSVKKFNDALKNVMTAGSDNIDDFINLNDLQSDAFMEILNSQHGIHRKHVNYL